MSDCSCWVRQGQTNRDEDGRRDRAVEQRRRTKTLRLLLAPNDELCVPRVAMRHQFTMARRRCGGRTVDEPSRQYFDSTEQRWSSVVLMEWRRIDDDFAEKRITGRRRLGQMSVITGYRGS